MLCCLPFLGAGASFPAIPLGSTTAADWPREYNYLGDNRKNLVEVAQFLAVQFDPLTPKEKILKQLDNAVRPDFNAADEPHGARSCDAGEPPKMATKRQWRSRFLARQRILSLLRLPFCHIGATCLGV
jgi:hypothetical protein